MMAGVVGVDPGPFTWRQLDLMYAGRLRSSWEQTASILCVLANQNRGRGDRMRSVSEFMPDIDTGVIETPQVDVKRALRMVGELSGAITKRD